MLPFSILTGSNGSFVQHAWSRYWDRDRESFSGEHPYLQEMGNWLNSALICFWLKFASCWGCWCQHSCPRASMVIRSVAVDRIPNFLIERPTIYHWVITTPSVLIVVASCFRSLKTKKHLKQSLLKTLTSLTWFCKLTSTKTRKITLAGCKSFLIQFKVWGFCCFSKVETKLALLRFASVGKNIWIRAECAHVLYYYNRILRVILQWLAKRFCINEMSFWVD